jgi:teichoic acid transport system ATP-binding protein
VAETSTLDPAPSTSTRRLAVSVRDLHIRFKVYSEQTYSMRRLVTRGFKTRAAEEVHAVRGVSLDIGVGEVVGVLGSNGSGKSTLLGAMSGLLAPTEGQVLVRSQPVLLGVNAALKKDLSGHRNIYLGCLAMGMTMSEIRERIDEVAEFTELGKALYRPMRTYSSGMRARLAFAIATLQRPDILLIDEALAVGDRHFRAKSLERVRELQADASTIVMVTHNLNEIRSTCSRALWIDQGQLHMDGGVDEVIDAYERTT